MIKYLGAENLIKPTLLEHILEKIHLVKMSTIVTLNQSSKDYKRF